MHSNIRSALLVAVALPALLFASSSHAQTAPPDLQLTPVLTSGQIGTAAIGLRHANDGSGRLFIIGRNGNIRIYQAGALVATPFLTIPVSTSGEQGLLGLAFHPQFSSNGRFYVHYTRTGGTQLGTTPDHVVAEYSVTGPNPNVADPASRREIMAVADLATNHNGGDLAFGPDGFLYISIGDGGPQNDPHGFAQCQWRKPADNTPASCASGAGINYSLLGKILRVDIDNTTPTASAELCGTTTGATANYAIPAGNPNVATASTCDEIWHYGMRNPFRFSFDRSNGDMLIADVGQGLWEEVSLVTNGSGPQNLGWRTCEGRQLRGSLTVGSCAFGLLPIIDYGHTGGRCSITGGYRYRGPISSLNGMYIYGDYCTREIFFGRPDAGQPSGWIGNLWPPAPGPVTSGIVGFGEDQAGDVYLTLENGTVSRFTSASGTEILFSNGFEP